MCCEARDSGVFRFADGSFLVNRGAGIRLIFHGPGDFLLARGNPWEAAMAPLLLLALIPVFFGGVAFVALLVSATTAGTLGAPEQRSLTDED
jgi:hypothetical protein